jgi:hypothetical protein
MEETKERLLIIEFASKIGCASTEAVPGMAELYKNILQLHKFISEN